jgi:hypothetical protein
MWKRWKNLRWLQSKEPPFFWQTEFLQKMALALFLMVAAAALVRVLTTFAQAGRF